jgi:hypothetical protein
MVTAMEISVPLRQFRPASVPLRAAGGGFAALAGLLALAATVLALTHSPRLTTVGSLEPIGLLGACLGLVWSRGGFRAGPVLGLLCAAGLIALPAALCLIAHRDRLGPVPMLYWTGSQVALAGAMGLVALWSALERVPESRGLAVRGLLLAIPAAVLAGVFLFGSRVGIDAAMAGLPAVVRAGIWGVSSLVAAVMLCMAAHFLSLAFSATAEAGTEDRPSVY